jgi:hypothetical protein
MTTMIMYMGGEYETADGASVQIDAEQIFAQPVIAFE